MDEPSRPFPGRVIFDHLPKTAGQAVNRWLTEALGTGCVVANVTSHHREMIRRYGGRYSVLSGHIAFDDGEGLDGRYQYVTLLREPLDRAASWIYYLLNNVPDVTSTRRLIDGARRFVETEGADTTDEFVKSFSNPYVAHFATIGGGGLTHGLQQLDIALEVVRRYDLVGLYEDMQGFLTSFAGLLGVAAPRGLERVNVTAGRPGSGAFSEALTARAVALNEWDILFYRTVAEWMRAPEAQRVWARPAPPRKSRWAPIPGAAAERVVTTPELVIASMGLPAGDQVVRGNLFEFEATMDIEGGERHLVYGIHIHDEDRRLVFATNSEMLGRGPSTVAPGRHNVRFIVAAEWPAGLYTIGFGVTDYAPEGRVPLAWHPVLCNFEVRNDEHARGPGHSPVPTVVTMARVG